MEGWLQSKTSKNSVCVSRFLFFLHFYDLFMFLKPFRSSHQPHKTISFRDYSEALPVLALALLYEEDLLHADTHTDTARPPEATSLSEMLQASLVCFTYWLHLCACVHRRPCVEHNGHIKFHTSATGHMIFWDTFIQIQNDVKTHKHEGKHTK